jgi:hypothetical protein
VSVLCGLVLKTVEQGLRRNRKKSWQLDGSEGFFRAIPFEC